MPPKKGTKRKAAKASPEVNGEAQLTPPNRDSWPGWVEMESEPAFFNVMLKEMGVKGVRIQEILELEDYMLATLPQPVHAFIFLFSYKDAEMTQAETECPQDVWFANQIPSFACASVALLNIVNNIKGLQMGKELRDFKDFTRDLDPMARGDAIDGFDFLKRIHNSFARETDLLNADMHMRNKVNKAKKRQATAKAQETKKAKKAGETPEKKRNDSAIATPTRASKRTAKPATKTKKAMKTEAQDSDASSPLSEPPDSDSEFTTARKAKKANPDQREQEPRRSGRKAKPRKDPTKLFSEAEIPADEDGFHYVAYLPVNGRVWQLDGLDSYPHLVGEFDTSIGGNWMNVAAPEIQARMISMGGQITYNLMAVVHDPIVPAKADLAGNVRELQTIESKLDVVSKDWREKIRQKRENSPSSPEDVVVGPCSKLDLAETDLAAAPRPAMLEEEIAAHEESYIDELIRLRKERVKAQAPMRASVRDFLQVAEADDEKARLRRHDFAGFVKGWLGSLADEEALKGLVDEQQEEGS